MSEEEKKQTINKESLKNSLCYIPFVSIVLFFTEQNKSVELMKHIKYGTMLLVIYLILNTVLGFLVPYAFLFIIYVVVIGIIMYRVYHGEQVDIEYLDKFESKVKEKWNDIEKKEENKKDPNEEVNLGIKDLPKIEEPKIEELKTETTKEL